MDVFKDLYDVNDSRILLVVADGLGGLPNESGKSEMETAHLPYLASLAAKSSLGLTDPVSTGITPGSGPAHMALFGYDPVENLIGRGVLEAMGIGMDLTNDDLCIRANFCRLDDGTGTVKSRRIRELSTEQCQNLVQRIQDRVSRIEDVEVKVRAAKDYRFVVVLRGSGLSPAVTESDPQAVEVPPKELEPLTPEAEKSCRILRQFSAAAQAVIRDEPVANYFLLRGYSKLPGLTTMTERFGLRPACVAAYPAYRGMARIAGMKVLETGDSWAEEVATVEKNRDAYDFFFLHFKELDKLGEDGKFAEKVKRLEELDALLPRIMALGCDVVAFTGDHSTPSVLRSHSWHPNPFLLWSKYVRPEGIAEFHERACARGGLGRMPATDVLPLLLAHARKLKKFGA